MMLSFLAVCLWLCAIAALLLRSFMQFRAYSAIYPSLNMKTYKLPKVDVIVPARNESANIARCLEGLLNQNYQAESLHITVVDDNSTDDTASIARKLAESCNCMRVLCSKPLPDGWTGKPHACWQGAGQAGGEWLCFVDADTTAGPDLIRTAVSFADAYGIDMLSLAPKQELCSFWERLVIPAGFLLISFFTNLKAVNDPDAPDAAAIGQFILIRRAVYENLGGHAAVKAEISEDSALAAIVKHAGYRTYIMDGKDLVSVRLYTGFRSLWEGLSKNATDIVGGVRPALAASVAGMFLGWSTLFFPLWTWLEVGSRGNGGLGSASFVLALCGAAVMFGASVSEARYFQIPLWYGLLFPIAATMVAAITCNSVQMQTTGSVVWKGRTYRGTCNCSGRPAENKPT
jgi:chlorobactene glucosyltransferase